MPPTFALSLRACCAAVVFVLAAHAADPAPSASPIGLTRDQIITRYGEPKSQIVVGNRLVMFFAREKLTLRDGVVIEVERISSDPATRRIAPPPPVPTPTPVETTPGAVTPPTAAPSAGPTTPAPAPAPTPVAPMPVAPAPVATAPTEATDPGAPSASEARLEIKSVRPPSANYSPRPASKQDPAAKAAPAVTSTPVAETPPATAPTKAGTASTATVPVALPPTVPAPVGEKSAPRSQSAVTTSSVAPDAAEVAKAEEEAKAEEAAAAAAAKAEKEKKVKLAKARRKLNDLGIDEEPDITEAFFTTRTYVITFLVVGGGIAFLFWRSRQRQLLLAATAVSRTPFSAPTVSASGAGAVFNSALLGKLEWKRFEELVAAYYVKTGVVAVRTKTGPASPVHIKISWKGEPRPFACVQCLPHPVGLVDAKRLQELVAVLAAEDIRRGYVVTTGKFNVNARDYAEEKHLTLLPGDIFLEKLNALPDAARNEIMQAVTNGENQTPSCPKCDAKMVRSPDDPTLWRCAAHTDLVIPVWQ